MSGNSNKAAMALGGGYNDPYAPSIPVPAVAPAPSTYQPTAPSPYNPTEAPLPYNPALASGTAPPHVTTDFPPPYSATPKKKAVPKAEKKCDVCHSMIDISMKKNYQTVKCNNCQEATALKGPPSGKKYIRCQCNCLIKADATSVKIICPRENCRRITQVAPGPKAAASVGPGKCRVVCGHCAKTMIAKSPSLSRCPKCQQVSSVDGYAKFTGFALCVGAIILLIIGVTITVVTYELASEYGGVYVVSVGSFVSAIYMFGRSIYYFTMTTSKPPVVA